MLSTSHFAPTSLSSDRKLLIAHDRTSTSHIIAHPHTSLHIIAHHHTSSYIIAHHHTSSHIIAHQQFEEVMIFRDTQTNRHFIMIYISSPSSPSSPSLPGPLPSFSTLPAFYHPYLGGRVLTELEGTKLILISQIIEHL